jgi:hypothetical protein
MKNNFDKFLSPINIFLVFLVSFGIYLSFIGGYGSDEDTLALIGAYESMLSGETLMASRFTPYPVAEMGIGFLSYQLGSWSVNLLTFLFIILSAIFLYLGIDIKLKEKNIVLFLILILSNPVIYFDNLEPIDYSWALLPLFIGLYFLKQRYYEIAIIFFGISIGTRIYFLLFLIPIIFLFSDAYKINLKRKLIIFFGSFFIGGLFYLPFWIENAFSLHWLTAATPYAQGLLGIIARFVYKIIMSFSFITFISFIIIFFVYVKKLKTPVYSKILIGIILFNLIIFFLIPAELSYLQPFLFAFYFLIFLNLKKKYIYTIIFLHFFSWFIEFQPIKIQYKSKDICNNVEAIGVSFNPIMQEGRFFQYINTRDKIKCWIKNPIRGEKIIQGKALK